MNRHRLITTTCYVAFVVLGVCGTLLGPMFQSLTQRFNMPLADGGIFTALQFAGVASANLIGGRLVDRLNARYLLCGGALVMGSGLILIGIAPVLPVALLGALFLGMGYGTLDVSSNVSIALLNPDRAGAALNTLNMYYGVGAIVGPQVVNVALGLHNFTLAFYATAVTALALVVPFSMISLHVPTGDGSRPPAKINWITLLPFGLLLFTYVGAEVGYSSWIFTQLTHVVLSTEAVAALATSAFWAGLTLGRVAASLLLRRLTDEQMLVFSILVLGAGVVLLLLAPTATMVAVISSFIVGAGCAPVFPLIVAMINNTYPEARGTASGTLMAGGTIGASVLPWIQGQVGGGINGGMIVVLVQAIVMLGIAMAIERQARPERAAV